jgi:diaminohydroxyphosphoribosylaminopyrimidine deaminase/5-amino-6-(5-phosphoribosylamino)uracil reductase
MRQALALAERARGRTSPNPMVGCVIVKGGRVIARGYHHKAGLAHAEVDALGKLGGHAPGATVYVTLEPCDHVGRTGPCTEALLAAGVARVVAGMRDPNPRVDGRGLKKLKARGVEVESGVLEAECLRLNRAYVKWVTTGRPLVTLKAAVTLDGRIAARTGDARWVSGAASRALAHELRDESDAILVGAGTVRADDPRLTTRLSGGKRGKDPLRVIVDGRLSISPRAKAVRGAVIVTSTEVRATRRRAYERAGAEVIALRSRGGRVDLGGLLDAIGQRGVTSLFVEGGGDVHGQLLAARLVDRVVLFIAPKLIGSGGVPLISAVGPAKMADAWQLMNVEIERAGDDVVLRGDLRGAT